MALYKGTNLISGTIPNTANKSLTNLDSTGQDKFDAKISKSEVYFVSSSGTLCFGVGAN